MSKRKLKTTLEQINDGEWFEIESNRGHYMACCDCGLVHRINFRVGQSGRIQMQPFRADRYTAKQRKKMESK